MIFSAFLEIVQHTQTDCAPKQRAKRKVSGKTPERVVMQPDSPHHITPPVTNNNQPNGRPRANRAATIAGNVLLGRRGGRRR
jgi:hypothetical protein